MDVRSISAKLLRSFSPFDRLGHKDLEFLANSTRLATAKKGDQLVHIGDIQENSLYLLSGQLRVIAMDGKEIAIDSRVQVPRDPISHLVPHRYEVICQSEVNYFVVSSKIIQNLLAYAKDSNERASEVDISQESLRSSVFQDIYNDLANDDLTLPDVTNLIKEVRAPGDKAYSESENIRIIMTDPVLASYYIRLANSSMLFDGNYVDTVPGSYKKLSSIGGLEQIQKIAGEETEQIFDANISSKLQVLWKHSIEMSVISRMLAKRIGSGLDPDVAMSLGLLQSVGMYVIYAYLYLGSAGNNERQAQEQLTSLHTDVSKIAFNCWNYPKIYSEVVANMENPWRNTGLSADYIDVVTLARLLSYVGKQAGRDTPPVRVETLPGEIAKVPLFQKFLFDADEPKSLFEFLAVCRRHALNRQTMLVSTLDVA